MIPSHTSSFLRAIALLFLSVILVSGKTATPIKIGPHTHYFAIQGDAGSKYAPSRGHHITNITMGAEDMTEEMNDPMLDEEFE